MNFFVEELETIAARHPSACVLVYRSDCPGETVIFDTWGAEAYAKDEVAACNKCLAPEPTGLEALFQAGGGAFDYMSAKAALGWLTDGETPWNAASLGEYGAYAYIVQAPRRAVSAFKARIDGL